MTAVDALESPNPGNIELLMQITEDRGDLVERMRKDFLSDNTASTADRIVLLQVTSVFERIVWMAHRLGALIDATESGNLVSASEFGDTTAGREANLVNTPTQTR